MTNAKDPLSPRKLIQAHTLIETLYIAPFQPFDCLILVHPSIQILETLAVEFQGLGIAYVNVNKGLSTELLTASASERGRFSQKWLMDTLATIQNGPVICASHDLLFDPSFKLDPLALFRQAAHFIQLIVLWPGDYSAGVLSYAIPEHHHFRTWNMTPSLLQQPVLKIQKITPS